MGSAIDISKAEARKLALHSQGLPSVALKGTALHASQFALERLSYVQIDTISVIQRAHHHTLWNRNPRYQPEHLDKLVEDKKAFEYWSHAAAYLPMSDYRFTLPRKMAIKAGEQKHWYPKDERMMQSVMERIRAEGPLMARDFEGMGQKLLEWQSKPAKQALINLFMQGDLMVCRREGFHKVYDLTERVLPAGISTALPSAQDHARWLIERYLGAHGLGQSAEMHYLLKDVKGILNTTLKGMLADDELLELQLGKEKYYALPNALEQLQKPLRRSQLKILSPFDNLIIQRKRVLALFDFDYQLECYVPQAKRKFGYFVLPLLWDGQLLGRMDCKAERKSGILHIHSLHYEGRPQKMEAFSLALSVELQKFVEFNGCQSVVVHSCKPDGLQELFSEKLKAL